MIFTRDCITRENHWRITSLVTTKSLFTLSHTLFYFLHAYQTLPAIKPNGDRRPASALSLACSRLRRRSIPLKRFSPPKCVMLTVMDSDLLGTIVILHVYFSMRRGTKPIFTLLIQWSSIVCEIYCHRRRLSKLGSERFVTSSFSGSLTTKPTRARSPHKQADTRRVAMV